MATITIKNLTFSYPGCDKHVLDGINLSVSQGEFILVCGKSGSGKTTLLRHMKAPLMPEGTRSGGIYYTENVPDAPIPVEIIEKRLQASKIGYVLQNPDNQIVTDKVWHELAFGLESLGFDSDTIRMRVAEMAHFFGIQEWFEKSTAELSGGQKQLLNLASIMVMQPEIIVLDEPTSRLDPIAAEDFLGIIRKVNRELGVSIIMAEQNLETVFSEADRVVVIDDGKVIADAAPSEICSLLTGEVTGEKLPGETWKGVIGAFPAPARICAEVMNYGIGKDLACPLNVREGRAWLDKLAVVASCGKQRDYNATRNSDKDAEKEQDCISQINDKKVIASLKGIWFRYERNGKDILKGVSLDINSGEILCITGGNGTGKTTMLKVLAGLEKPYRGKINAGAAMGMLQQDPQLMFSEKDVASEIGNTEGVLELAKFVEIDNLFSRHPYDLSGGEQQRVALAKVLIKNPEILLLDEPTKGLDAELKKKLGTILNKLKALGKTIVIVSHDIEFCAEYGDRCAMLFDGQITTVQDTRRFFAGNSFYTTAANRMTRHIFRDAVTVKDAVECIKSLANDTNDNNGCKEGAGGKDNGGKDVESDAGGNDLEEDDRGITTEGNCTSEKDRGADSDLDGMISGSGTFFKNIFTFVFLLVVPICAALAAFYVDDRKYYAVSLIMVIYAMGAFTILFERHRPRAREIVTVSVLIALTVIGRAVFFMVPAFKPSAAIVIVTGLCLGPQTGFLVGAASAFISNFFFGQGPWTPWQMLAYGSIGLVFGMINSKLNKYVLAALGALSVFFLYGAIVDIYTIIGFYPEPSLQTALTVYGLALPFNIIHAVSTAIFLIIIGNPMIEKINRVKIKYGLFKCRF